MNALSRENRRQITEAIANILARVRPENVQEALQSFILPLAQRLHEVSEIQPTDSEHVVGIVKEASDIIDQLSIYFKIVQPDVASTGPHPVVTIISSLWPLFNTLLDKYPDTPLSDALARLFKYCIKSYRFHFYPLLPALMTKTLNLFETTKNPCYIWITKQCIQEFGDDESEQGKKVFELFEGITRNVFILVHSKKTDDLVESKELVFLASLYFRYIYIHSSDINLFFSLIFFQLKFWKTIFIWPVLH